MVQLTILVTDTNIWIDLVNGEILEMIFGLPFTFMIPDIAESEFSRQPKWDLLLKLGVVPGELNGYQVADLINITQVNQSLSSNDVAAFILARDLATVLLTGDKHLRKMASDHGVQVHGLLWLMDELVGFGILDKNTAFDSLLRIMSQNSRLPQSECQERLKRWSP